VQPHTPDVTSPLGSYRLAPAATPTRGSGEHSDLNDLPDRISLNNSQAPFFRGNTDVFARAGQSPSTLYMTSNTAFALPPDTVPVVMSGLYTPSRIASFQQSYAGSIHGQPYLGGNGFSAFTSPGYNDQPYAQNGLEMHGFNTSAFQQNNHPEFGYFSPRSPVSSRDLGVFNRPGGRRQIAAKVPHHSTTRGRQYSNPAACHHNHVDIHRIRQGIDVRTTVSIMFIYFGLHGF
jgi:hypothetical protein